MELTQTSDKKILTVSELSRIIKGCLEEVLPDIWLQGEVSNCTYHSSGHIYFSLKDEDAQIRCVLFRGNSYNIKFKIEDGMQLVAHGRISTYIKRGEYQIIVDMLEPAGKGALQLAFEQLKKKLEKEGLFNPERKKPIPVVPQKIGVVTSPTGAAIHDILTVINRRYANVHILIYPVRVQGEGAAGEIVNAIAYLNEHFPDIDVLLVGRGGGSLEDLWAFNEEITARAIAGSRIPVISCVGHEIDFTIADFVADLRAPTPSAAAELVVQNKAELKNRIQQYIKRIITHIQYTIQSAENKLKLLTQSRSLRNPKEIMEERIQIIDDMKERLIEKITYVLEQSRNNTHHLQEKLHILSPLACLGRGYAIAWKMPEKLILRKTSDLKENDSLKLKLYEGEAEFTIQKLKQSTSKNNQRGNQRGQTSN